jgi:hypothetical protein
LTTFALQALAAKAIMSPAPSVILSDTVTKAEAASLSVAATGGGEAIGASIGAEVDAAFASGRVQSGTMIRFTDEAGALSGSGPKTGTGGIWFHDNIKVPGAGPGGSAIQIRTHSANPGAPPGSFSFGNYTTQVNTNSGLYLLPNGTWKPPSTMSPAEISAAHFPAGN